MAWKFNSRDLIALLCESRSIKSIWLENGNREIVLFFFFGFLEEKQNKPDQFNCPLQPSVSTLISHTVVEQIYHVVLIHSVPFNCPYFQRCQGSQRQCKKLKRNNDKPVLCWDLRHKCSLTFSEFKKKKKKKDYSCHRNSAKGLFGICSFH